MGRSGASSARHTMRRHASGFLRSPGSTEEARSRTHQDPAMEPPPQLDAPQGACGPELGVSSTDPAPISPPGTKKGFPESRAGGSGARDEADFLPWALRGSASQVWVTDASSSCSPSRSPCHPSRIVLADRSVSRPFRPSHVWSHKSARIVTHSGGHGKTTERLID
jgi:hypothetical protein